MVNDGGRLQALATTRRRPLDNGEDGGGLLAARVGVAGCRTLARERLESQLAGIWSRRLGLVVAPAGSGKTTLLARFAVSVREPVAWYRAETWDGPIEVFLRRMQQALGGDAGRLAGNWGDVDRAIRTLERCDPEPTLLVVDDLQKLDGTPAELALARLIESAPPWLVFLSGSRVQPRLDLPRLRARDLLIEIGSDDLRFRSWEVERLFADVYQRPLPPVELAELARRTEGWGAGLHLFHLATRGKTPDQRRRFLAGLDRPPRFLREYLTSEVLDQLPDEVRRFLIDTCVLGRLSGRICDRFLSCQGSRAMLADLERRQIFIQALDDEESYRYHEVLRSHLLWVLIQESGESEAADRHRRAGEVLEDAGALPEALHAYSRAAAWPAVRRLLGNSGEKVITRLGAWIDALPTAVLDQDPWLVLASARRHRAEGRWKEALASYVRAEEGFDGSGPAYTASRERVALATWLTPWPSPARDLLSLLRSATMRDPSASRTAATLSEADQGLLDGLGELLAGNVIEARRRLRRVLAAPDAAAGVSLGAQIGLAAAGLLSGEIDAVGPALDATETAESLGFGILARLGRGCKALASLRDCAAEASASRFLSERLGDGWGAALTGLMEAWARLRLTQPAETLEAATVLEEVASWFEQVHAPVLQAWAMSWLAVARARLRQPNAVATALQAERLANATGTVGPAMFAYLILAAAKLASDGRYFQLAQAIKASTGLATLQTHAPQPAPPIKVRLFGGLEIMVHGEPLDITGLKPRVRSLLRFLAAHGDRPVHRETIQEALWPDADRESGSRNLQVALSSLRQLMSALLGANASGLLVRHGDAYQLALDKDSEIDLVSFLKDVTRGRRARAAGDAHSAINVLGAALERYAGELLPEEGAAEWVVELRDRCRQLAIESAESLAQLLLECNRPEEAARACDAGLRIDRYSDALWRLLVEARERAGDQMAARKARMVYDRMLAELGLCEGLRSNAV